MVMTAPNEGYGLLTLAHILDQVLLVNLPEFSHLEGGNFAAGRDAAPTTSP